MREDLKTFGAVEVVLGLIEVSLAAVLTPVQTSFKKQIFCVFISGGAGILMGMCLVLAGRQPSYCCLKHNSIYRLASTLFAAVAFGFMVKNVPYRHRCGDFCYGETVRPWDPWGRVSVLCSVQKNVALVSSGSRRRRPGAPGHGPPGPDPHQPAGAADQRLPHVGLATGPDR